MKNDKVKLKTKNNKRFFFLFVVFSFLFLFFNFSKVEAASLLLIPSTGTFEAGSTFDVSVFLDTEGEIINAVDVSLSFPPNKLQLVSPSAGQSVVGIWAVSPKFDNQIGSVNFQGGIPGGIKASRGLLTRLTFRVKALGTISVNFLDSSRVLLHDGKGTNVLNNKTNGVYSLVSPPPAGPIVSSSTHPDAAIWYSNKNINLTWIEDSNPDGYSFIFNQNPIDATDDISEGNQNSIFYPNTGDGIYYFHIKALKDKRWGGITHFPVQIDSSPPADFPIEIIPYDVTTRSRPIIQFSTTDNYSGIDHYELKIISLNSKFSIERINNQELFIEAQSPYIFSELEAGSYEIIIRAYDRAGNYKEIKKNLSIINSISQIIEQRFSEIKNWSFIPLFFVLLVILILVYIGWRIRMRYRSNNS